MNEAQKEIIKQALAILSNELHVTPDIVANEPSVVKDYLIIKLSEREREVFAVLHLDNHEISKKMEYQQRVGSYSVGNTIQFNILREGREKKIRLHVKAISRHEVENFTLNWLGLRIQRINDQTLRQFRLSTRKGVVVTEVIKNSASGQIGLIPGDVIRQFNQNKIRSEEDFNKAVLEAGNRDSALLLVQRGNNGYYVTLEP